MMEASTSSSASDSPPPPPPALCHSCQQQQQLSRALLKAVRSGDLAASRRLLGRPDFPWHRLDSALEEESGSPALLVACEIGRLDLVKLLLRHGASLHARDRLGWDALHTVCWFHHQHLLGHLLARLRAEAAGPTDRQLEERRCG